MSYPKRFLLAGVVALIAFCAMAISAQAQVFSGEGQAQLGPNTTPKQAKELAFQRARKNALRKFGVEVRSRQKLQTATSSGGRTEMTEGEIATLAVGDASLVSGSKETSRNPTEATVVYVVKAKFNIDPSNFEKTLEAYQNAGPSSELRESVSTAARWQDRLSDFDEETSQLETQELLARTRKAYNTAEGNIRNFDSDGYRRRRDRQLQRLSNSVRRYVDTILKHGFPSDIMRFRTRRPETRGGQGMADFEYYTDVRPKNFQKLMRSCRETSRNWEQRGTDVSSDLPVLAKPVRLLMLDEDGNVLMMMDKADPHDGRGPVLQIEYEHCDPGRMFGHYNFDGIGNTNTEVTWEADISAGWLRPVDKFVLAVLKGDYKSILDQKDYTLRDDYIWQQAPKESRVPAENLIYTREQFQRDIRDHVSTSF